MAVMHLNEEPHNSETCLRKTQLLPEKEKKEPDKPAERHRVRNLGPHPGETGPWRPVSGPSSRPLGDRAEIPAPSPERCPAIFSQGCFACKCQKHNSNSLKHPRRPLAHGAAKARHERCGSQDSAVRVLLSGPAFSSAHPEAGSVPQWAHRKLPDALAERWLWRNGSRSQEVSKNWGADAHWMVLVTKLPGNQDTDPELYVNSSTHP